jgi:ABC-type amino acid transport system, permease component
MKKKLLVLLLFILSFAPVFAAKSTYEKVADLDGKTIGVQTAVLYEELIQDRAPNATIQYYTMPNDMILALKSGKVDAYLIEEVSYGVQKKNHPDLAVLDEAAGFINATCIMGNNARKDRLLAELNAFIAESNANGLLDELYDYWITDFDPVNDTCDISGFSGENGKIAVGVEGGYEPFSFISNGKISGFDVDFICRFAREYGYTPEFHEVPFEAIAPGVESGKYDIGMNIVVSEERNETGTLSDIYYSTPIRVVVMGESDETVGFFEQLKISIEKTFLREGRWKLFAQGAGVTLLITITAIIAGTILGFLVYLLCRRGGKISNGVTNFFLWLIHGMPTVLLLMILYYVVFGASSLSGMWVSVIGFSLMFACSMIDMLRVGCNAIGRGQREAAKAMGYSENLSFFKIILPQAAQHFLPIYRNEVVTLIKETSVVGYIAVLDLTKISDLVRSRTYEAFFPLITTAIMYFVLTALLTRVVTAVEKSINPRHRRKEKILKGIVEQE